MAFDDSSNHSDTEVNKILKITSSLNSYYICNYCDKQFDAKCGLIRHLDTCLSSRTCSWCNITFRNRGNLVRHALCVHGDKSAIKPRSVANSCMVCCQTFPDSTRLIYHIRSLHFNLKGKIMCCEDKEINQVWFEKVYNSSKIVEIKKAGHNLLLIRKFEDDLNVTIQECKYIDLSDLYPIRPESSLGQCRVCDQTLLKRDLKKHYDERHMQIQKHHCNNCNRSFKRSVAYVRHVCNRQDRRRKLIL